MTISKEIRAAIELSKRNEIAYLSDMIRELRDMALARRDGMLSYFLELAYMEAQDRLRGQADQGRHLVRMADADKRGAA